MSGCGFSPERNDAQGAAVAVCELWRRGRNGNRVRAGVFADWVEALATVLALEYGWCITIPIGSMGPPGSVSATNRDLCSRLVREGERMTPRRAIWTCYCAQSAFSISAFSAARA
jgi:hypothetical protein